MSSILRFARPHFCFDLKDENDLCLLRAKWFELMNTEEAEAVEEEGGHKRKREDKAEDAVKVKKIKLKVTRW